MAFSLEDWVRSNLERVSGASDGELSAVCPFCMKYGGFYVNCSYDKDGPFICFKCNEMSTSMIKLIAYVEEISYNDARKMVLLSAMKSRRRETVSSLSERIKRLRGKGCDSEELDLYEEEEISLPKEFVSVFVDGKWKVPAYLTERGFNRNTLLDWEIGYCRRGFFGGRIIIPIDCPNGKSFTARDIFGTHPVKYLNPKGANHNNLIFGWKQVPLMSDFTIVEGAFDAMKLYQYGFPSYGLGGKVLYEKQIPMIFARPRNVHVTVMLDPEAVDDAMKVASHLSVYFDRVDVARLPNGVDPGSATKQQVLKAYRTSVRYTGSRISRLSVKIKASREKLERKF
jgi:DNA primase